MEGRIVFSSNNLKRTHDYLLRRIKKEFGATKKLSRAEFCIWAGKYNFFTNQREKWFYVYDVQSDRQAVQPWAREIPYWTEAWIDKTLNKDLVRDKLLPRARGEYKIHWY